MKKILLATDGSPIAKKTAREVKALLDAFEASQVTVLYVVKPRVVDGLTYAIPSLDDDLHDPAVQAIQEQVDQAFEAYEDRVSFKVVDGYPAMTICQYAEEIQADLIVVGSHGRGAVDRLLLGSVSNGVVHRANTPVLVVK